MLTISLAAVFLVKIRACRVKNARKMSNLAVLFSLHPRIFPQKTASQAECQQPLETLSLTYISETLAGRFTVFADASSAIDIIDAATERQIMSDQRENADSAALSAYFAQFLAACGLALPSAHT